MKMNLELLLRAAGVLHFTILIASALVPRIFDWRRELALLSPFLRRLFWVYGGFIVLTIIGFGTITLLNASALAGGSALARMVCGFIAVFWLARLAVQFFVFDPRPYLTHWILKAGYHGLTLVFLFLVAVYGWAALVTPL